MGHSLLGLQGASLSGHPNHTQATQRVRSFEGHSTKPGAGAAERFYAPSSGAQMDMGKVVRVWQSGWASGCDLPMDTCSIAAKPCA